jgi:hypothetical protein
VGSIYNIVNNCKNETGNGNLIMGSKVVTLNINVHCSISPFPVKT